MGKNIKPILNRNSKFGLLFVVCILFAACEFTPKGGGALLYSESIFDSKKVGAFVSAYQSVTPCFEYRDSIVNIKICFKEAFVEYGHKEIQRIPAYNPPQYAIFDFKQLVATIDLDNSILAGMDSLWYFDDRFTGIKDKVRFDEITNEDTIKVKVVSGYGYNDIVGIDRGESIYLGKIQFVQKSPD
ncbi:MAG: hypothetical protein LBR81_04200 [Prevotellaceae bacterium]|jgi:hypothetical protein|nr:hypothetical protein [Prevotellaceae bacterium]